MHVARVARKHGVADEDMLHATRNAIAQWRLDDDLRCVLVQLMTAICSRSAYLASTATTP
jgi:hypothetical protein